MPAHKLPRLLFSCFLPVGLLFLTACGSGFNQQSSVQPGLSKPDTPATPASPPPAPTPTPSPTPTPTPVPSPTPTPVPSPQHLYFTYSGSIYGFELHEDGSLTSTPNSPYIRGDGLQGTSTLTLNAAGTMGVAATADICPRGCDDNHAFVSTFSVVPDSGELLTLQVNKDLGYVANGAFDDSGSYLYASTYNAIRAFSVSPQGELTELAGSPFPAPIFGYLRNDPSSHRFFVVGYNYDISGKPSVFSFVSNVEGIPVLTAGPIGFVSNSPIAITTDSQGKHLFVLDGAQSTGNLHVFSISAGITEVEGSPFTIVNNGYSIAIDPTGAWFYTASIINGIAQYPFDEQTGRIGELLSLTPVNTIRSLVFDRTGKYLIATNLPKIYVYELDGTGAPRLVSTTSLF